MAVIFYLAIAEKYFWEKFLLLPKIENPYLMLAG
jgi:hypothetical protein